MELISVVVTLFNEEANVAPLLTAIEVALVEHRYEVVLVDDGSTDKTVDNIQRFADARVQLVRLSRNYGQTAAMAAGIAAATGDFIVTMDGDLQNDPADIPAMLKKLKAENLDVVCGVRQNRKDGFILRKVPSKVANFLIRNLTGVTSKDYGCSLKVFKRDVAKQLDLYGEMHRFIPILATLQGARLADMPVNHKPRIYGQSKYGLNRTFKVASDLLLLVFFQKYFKRPIHFFGPIGLVAFSIGAAISLYMLVLKMGGEDIWGRPLLILGTTLVLAGIQFITLGIMAELMMRTYFESQSKKTYSVREVLTFNRTNPTISAIANPV